MMLATPNAARIELPILQELVAIGGEEDVRFLYDRLTAYFPQLSDYARNGDERPEVKWRRSVQRAGRLLSEKREIERHRGQWRITERGRRRANEEGQIFKLETETRRANDSHADIQQMLLDIGRVLGYHAEREFDYYDVVWRASATTARLSHVFEVQHKGNIDAALVKLKRAFDTSRSKLFLVVASERDTERARRAVSLDQRGGFHEINLAATIISFEQLRQLHRALTSVESLLAVIFER
jgi:putative lipoic acid-binding regulatory protein